MPIATTGGSPGTALKKENGAAFSVPSVSCVVTQAIGRRPMVATRSLYMSLLEVAAKSNSMVCPRVCMGGSVTRGWGPVQAASEQAIWRIQDAAILEAAPIDRKTATLTGSDGLAMT